MTAAAPGHPCHRRADRGSGTVLVLCVASLVATAAAVLVALGSVAVARHRAASAADLAALAAADRALQGTAAACVSAGAVTAAVSARLLSCRLDGADAVVVVEVRPAGPLRAWGAARGVARAGPPTG